MISANIQKYEIVQNYPNFSLHFFINILPEISIHIIKSRLKGIKNKGQVSIFRQLPFTIIV
ncbi:hypothetical protein DRF65_15180 [Chryseobacterium pennae]|uniref:Uncharacterized protein n=1 Tax=Chryseobacterium pennae TaxID=2258962 RepID=A0A3D9C6M2_9FLAO|nr:hypothetical protein DRF65_15180 [Chryseobacterium pennae]